MSEEPTIYITSEDNSYRLKFIDGVTQYVRIEQQRPTHQPSMSYELNVYGRPLLWDRYWDHAVIDEVIQRYKADTTESTPIASAQDVSAEDEEWAAHNAAHRINFMPSSHPGFKRLVASLEQRDPNQFTCMPAPRIDLAHEFDFTCNDCFRPLVYCKCEAAS